MQNIHIYFYCMHHNYEDETDLHPSEYLTKVPFLFNFSGITVASSLCRST